MTHLRNRRAGRWVVTGVLVAVLASLPSVVAAWPARSDPTSAAALLTRMQSSTHVGFSGYAQSVGGLSLPVTSQFPDLVDLVGSTVQLRAWWRAENSYRVDVLSSVGEKDLTRDRCGTWQWDYQANRATRVSLEGVTTRVRLPTAYDLLPSELGHRLLSEATSAETSRLPVQRIAGRDAPGLRIRPSQSQTSIDHVDVWADPSTGLPIRVSVYGRGASAAAVSTSFLDLTTSMPTAAQVRFSPPPGVQVIRQRGETQGDLASAVDRFARGQPPAALAGLDRTDRGDGFGAIGIYGQGVTELVAVPLWDRIADPLRRELGGAATAVVSTDGSITLAAGPIALRLTPEVRGRSWLLAGTVTTATLADATTQLTGAAA